MHQRNKILWSVVAGFMLASQAHAATLSLSPSSSVVNTGENFMVTINLDTQGVAVDGVDVYYLNYNPQLLQLQDAASGTQGVQISPGSLFAQTTANSADTTLGRIAFSQAAAGGQTYTGSGALATMTFKALATGTTNVTFSYTSGSTVDTNVASAGSDVLSSVANGYYALSGNNTIPEPPDQNPVDPPATGQPHSNGCMINDNGTYYLLVNSQRIGVANPGLLFSHGYDFHEAVLANMADRQLPLGQNLKPGDGALVKKPGDATVFLVTGGVKHGFVSAEVFLTLGYRFSSVLTVTGPELDAVPLGDVIRDAYAKHHYGVHVNQDGTVYWMGGALKHPYPSQQVFNTWNIDNDFSHVVPANAADRAVPVGDLIPARPICK